MYTHDTMVENDGWSGWLVAAHDVSYTYVLIGKCNRNTMSLFEHFIQHLFLIMARDKREKQRGKTGVASSSQIKIMEWGSVAGPKKVGTRSGRHTNKFLFRVRFFFNVRG